VKKSLDFFMLKLEDLKKNRKIMKSVHGTNLNENATMASFPVSGKGRQGTYHCRRNHIQMFFFNIRVHFNYGLALGARFTSL